MVKQVKKKGFFLSCRNKTVTIDSESESELESTKNGLERVKLGESSYEYDFIVIGGGSGGISAARQAFELGAKVCVFDYVEPSPRGTVWDIGGTCVNVGCIPKKLMHQAALLGEAVRDSKAYGWNADSSSLENDWPTLVEAVSRQIHSTNFTTKAELNKKIKLYNRTFARFKDPHTIIGVKKNGTEFEVTGKYILIAVGGRPNYPDDVDGAVEYGITSDDIFSKATAPGKTLIVGGGYVGLECAGFINALGFEVEVMVRSSIMKNFDQQMIGMVVEDMEKRGVRFLRNRSPSSLSKQDNGLILVESGDVKTYEMYEDYYDTVLFAIGRHAVTKQLELEKAGVKVTKNGKISTVNEQTNVSHIYAVGDCIDGTPELTPVAINAGKLLAQRLFGKSEETMDYTNVATTLFTPLEYGTVGMTEEEADKLYGSDNIEVYHTYYVPFECSILPDKAERTAKCYLKVVAKRYDDEKILGLHFIGPNAGEVIQGYAVSIKCQVSWPTFRATVGIHPTSSEQLVRVFITKRSGIDPVPPNCCS